MTQLEQLLKAREYLVNEAAPNDENLEMIRKIELLINREISSLIYIAVSDLMD